MVPVGTGGSARRQSIPTWQVDCQAVSGETAPGSTDAADVPAAAASSLLQPPEPALLLRNPRTESRWRCPSADLDESLNLVPPPRPPLIPHREQSRLDELYRYSTVEQPHSDLHPRRLRSLGFRPEWPVRERESKYERGSPSCTVAPTWDETVLSEAALGLFCVRNQVISERSDRIPYSPPRRDNGVPHCSLGSMAKGSRLVGLTSCPRIPS